MVHFLIFVLSPCTSTAEYEMHQFVEIALARVYVSLFEVYNSWKYEVERIEIR